MAETASRGDLSTLIGRQREQRLLWREFDLAVTEARTRIVVISGEPGIGKTRLLTQFADAAEREGGLILRGLTAEAEGMPPYLPFLEALGHYIREAPLMRLRRQIGAVASALSPLFPEVAQRLGNLPVTYELPTEQARYRLYEALTLFVFNVCASQPVLFLLDDVQWADEASLDLLEYVVRHQPRMRLLILAGLRSGEAARANLAHLLAELDRIRCLTAAELAPLSADEIAQLAQRYLGAPLDAEAAQTLYIHSEGNPFFAEELLRDWQETERLHFRETVWHLAQPVEGDYPSSILRAIEQRLARLPVRTLDLLRSAAVIGRQFEIDFLADVVGQEVEPVELLLAAAVQARLIRLEPRGFTFTHDMIRQVLYQQVPLIRRQRLHGFIGHALENRRQRRSAQQLGNLAFHFSHSGDRERGIHYAQLAAEHAMSAYAPKEALRHYRTALELFEQMDQAGLTAPRMRGELLLGFGEAALQAGMEGEALRAFETALAWFRHHPNPLLAARAAYGLGRARWQTESISAAQEAFMLALDLLASGGHSNSSHAAQIHVDLANLLVLSRQQYEQGMVHAQRVFDIAEKLEDKRLAAAALRTMGNLYVRANRLSEGIEHLERALAQAVEIDDPSEAAEACMGISIALVWLPQLTRVKKIADRLISFAERCQTRYFLRHVYSLLMVFNAIRGELDAADEYERIAREIVEPLASPEPHAFLKMCRGWVTYVKGDYAAMQETISQAIEAFRGFGESTLVWYLGFDALAKLENGQIAEARACCVELETLLKSIPEGSLPTAEAIFQLTMCYLSLGEYERLRALYPKLMPFRGQYHDALCERLLGAIEILQGEWDKAEHSLRAAEAQARREGLRWELAHTLASRADLELARGGAGSVLRARQLLAEARDIFKAFGNKTYEKRLRERLRNLPRQAGEKLPRPAPAGLSRREIEVLKRIAAGKSNREIAEELALSEKTVANHATAIFNKIGVDNRASAAAFAVRQGLI